jgi:bacillithiol biosynthesis deacetylase BshB1
VTRATEKPRRPGSRREKAVRPVDVLAIGPHPDDVELGCGGTLAALARRGFTFGICDLTRGEMGTRGTPDVRAAEARKAAGILGASFRETLDLGDGGLRTDRAAELALISVIRRARPRLVLAPHREDRHPDHVRASRLVTDAAWYAGLKALETGSPAHRPQQVVYYPTSFVATPSFLVDVTDVFSVKLAAIRAYASQFHDPLSREAETYISTSGFLDGITARAQAFGRFGNVAFAEGFVALQPPTLADPVAAFEGYEPGDPAVRKKRP